MRDDETFDAEELREAEALARALERGTADEHLPDEALQTAALLRYSAGGGVLAKDREDAVLEDVLKAADRVAARPAPARAQGLRYWLGALGLAAAIGLVLLLIRRPGEVLPTALPEPSAELLQAQLARLEDRSADARFDSEMRSYRGAVYAALEARYEGAR
jgi:hypothetical protein